MTETNKTGVAVDYDPFASPALARSVATTEAQRELWLGDKLGKEASLAFNEAITIKLRGVLDVIALEKAWSRLLARHEALRATLSADGSQLLVAADAAADWSVTDLSAEPSGARDAAIAHAKVKAVETPFDLERGPLVRARLFTLTSDEHVLLVEAHHVVVDGWSYGVIVADLGALYAEAAGKGPGPDAAVPYSDYVVWEAKESQSDARVEHEKYWLQRFAGGALPVLDLPTDRRRAPHRSFASRRVDRDLDAELCTAVKKVGGKHGASMFATLFAGFAATLKRITDQDDVVIGVPAAGQSQSGMARMVGHCVNTLPVRTAVDASQSFAQFLEATSTTLLDAFDHQTFTYGTLLQKLPLKRDPSRLPLVSVMFNVDQAVSSTSSAFPDLAVEIASVPRHFENFELFINCVALSGGTQGGGMRLECQYNADLYDGETVDRWLGAFEMLLRSAVNDPARAVGKLDIVTADERARLAALQPARTDVPAGALMHSAFVKQAAATPKRIALQLEPRRASGANASNAVVDGAALTYEELDEQSTQLAHALRARGVARGDRVGLCLSRGLDMVVGLLGVLKAGATYVPLDPGFPEARLAYYAEDAHLALLITHPGLASAPRSWRQDASARILELDDKTRASLANEAKTALPSSDQDAQPSDAAYIIYTSGSTGKPKGVCVPHRAVANFLVAMANEPGITSDDALAAVTTLSFDIAVFELMLPLTVGARVVIVSRESAMDGNLLKHVLVDSKATMMDATPSMWRLLLDTDWNGGANFRGVIGGEPLPPDLALALCARLGALWNGYGPTETTVYSTMWHVDPAYVKHTGVVIGKPIGNTTIRILDANQQPVPLGVPGEICIGGNGVTLGYHDRKELTAERFVSDPFAKDAIVYRTGDRGRFGNDGLLAHLGRLDFQVKVRGYRIELGEIEHGCNEVADVAQTVAMAREDRPGDVRLVAYVTNKSVKPEAEHAGIETAVKAHLKKKLPEYMVPAHVVVLEKMPLLANGKVDRKALPAPDLGSALSAGERVAPRNAREEQVQKAFEAVLNLPGLGVTDDFFALGGHSLLAARLTSRLNKDFELNLPLRTLFESPTVEKLAAAIDAARTSGTTFKRAPLVHRDDQSAAPLAVNQERIRFLEELYPGRVVYNTPSAHRLTGKFDRANFEKAFAAMVQRQPVLRTQITRDDAGKWWQEVKDDVAYEMPFVDLSTMSAETREPELMKQLQAIIDTPMDINTAPLFRVGLWKLRDDEHAFLFMPHHIIWDGWSFDLLYDEMSALYGALVEGKAPTIAPVAITYGDYVEWHDEWREGAEAKAQLAYWKQRNATAPVMKAPPTDKPRQASMSGIGATEWIHIDPARTARLREIARNADVTLNMLTFAAYAVMMSRAIDSEYVSFGIPVRGRLMIEVESVMGFFNNLVALGVRMDKKQSFVAFVKHLKKDLLDAFAHQDLPFELLSAEPDIAARTQKSGLYQALFSYQDARDRKRQWGGLQQKGILVFQKGATEDLGLWLMELPNHLEGGFIYNADIFSEATAKLFHSRYEAVLARVLDDPQLGIGALGEVGAEELARLEAWSAATAGTPRVVDAAEQPQPIGVPGTLWKDGKPTRIVARWTADGQLQVIEPEPGAKVQTTPQPIAHMTSTEKALAEVWSQLLGVNDIRLQDNFFELGGSSLLAMQATQLMEKRINKRITARKYVFDDLRSLAKSYDDAETIAPHPSGGGPPPTTPGGGGIMKRLSGMFRRS